MSQTEQDTIEIRRGTLDQVLVLSIDMPGEQVAFLRNEPAALAQVLGVEQLDAAQAELIAIDDLEDLGLLGYLQEGLGVSETNLSTYGMLLDGLSGYVLLLRSRAFATLERHVHLSPADGLTLVARLGEEPTDWHSKDVIETASALPRPAMAPRAARNRARRIGASLFAIVMMLLVILIYVLAT